jgi:hypothetical protein
MGALRIVLFARNPRSHLELTASQGYAWRPPTLLQPLASLLGPFVVLSRKARTRAKAFEEREGIESSDLIKRRNLIQ